MYEPEVEEDGQNAPVPHSFSVAQQPPPREAGQDLNPEAQVAGVVRVEVVRVVLVVVVVGGGGTR